MDCDADPPDGVREDRSQGVGRARSGLPASSWPQRWCCSGCGSCTGFSRRSPGPRVLAIALWPLYWRLARAFSPRGTGVLAPLVVTLLVGLASDRPARLRRVRSSRARAGSFRYDISAKCETPACQCRPGYRGFRASAIRSLGWWQANLSDPQMTLTNCSGASSRAFPLESASRLRR